jgi:alkylated DNA repair dioxygenase AlkB|tara:strand:- start:206 stop:757 length:552 start_codon:yes stop_codon:yes gene_type:complete
MRLLSVFYQRDFLPSKDADHWLNWLQQENNVAWARESFSIFGRRVTAPRRLAWFGDAGLNYRYTGTDHMAEGWPTALSALRDRVQAVAAQEFNFLLLNRYANGQQYMGWHRDDEAGCAGNIASLSLGAPRRFRYESEINGKSEQIDLEHGSLLLFDGRRRHCLAKTVRPVEERINLTFRLLKL